MPLELHWTDIALRLALTVLAAIAIGYNRSEHGKAAGMRTTLLVCLAASVAMIQVNLLLPLAGRSPDSFVMNDLMRLPLGILTGVGFIGGGAILRRENMVVGVTTAATLWMVTVIGLCLGGGQLGLGIATTALGLVALWVLPSVEDRMPRERTARLSLHLDESGVVNEQQLRDRLSAAGFVMQAARVVVDRGICRELVYEVRVTQSRSRGEMPEGLRALIGQPGIASMQWDTLD
jgi:putative Mg2+ transporter-C (MgtC) family protein